ncbi:PREDICTED: uncharacterized protein LOC108446351 isoform X1 [Corvus brachyrhynchos]|uniref:uncharacterized protein LOC108446351 isoform X1 n=1 Tax=Corvus brachyrhynchos TaxID=85066 RepID=UPI00081673A4|nr:PREDICTED: uncharacterized protein LOC108446351 isoform X1 [Corvus brachyrhynchos]
MCWELGVNSSADPCPLATKPLPVLLLPCFPRMPAGLHGSRTTGSAALTFPIRRKRCFLASCEVCSGRAVGSDSGGAAAALPAPHGIPVSGRSTERIPGPAAPWIPAHGEAAGICVPVPCPGCGGCRVFPAGLVSDRTEWIKKCEGLKAGRTLGCARAVIHGSLWLGSRSRLCVLKDRQVWNSLPTNISPGHSISCTFPTWLRHGALEADYPAISADKVLFPLSSSQIFPGKCGAWRSVLPWEHACGFHHAEESCARGAGVSPSCAIRDTNSPAPGPFPKESRDVFFWSSWYWIGRSLWSWRQWEGSRFSQGDRGSACFHLNSILLVPLFPHPCQSMCC